MARMSKMLTAVVAAAALALAGCSSSSSDDSSKAAGENKESRGTITFAMGKNDTDKLLPVIEKWNAAHPDEKVELKELAGEADQQRDTLSRSLESKSGDYDVMALDVTDTAFFAAKGWLQQIDGDMKIDVAGLLPATVASATYAGKLYAVPQNTNAQLLFRNTDIAPEAPADWAALTASCDKAREANVDCLITQLKQYEGLTVNTTEFIHGWGGTVVGEDGKTPTVDTPEAKAGLQALADAVKSGVISDKSLQATEEETNNAFVAGEVAYAVNWPYMFDNAGKPESKVAGKFAVSPIVGEKGAGASSLGGYNNAINVYSEHKATARDFVAFVISEENQRAFAEKSFPPVLASIYDDAALIEQFPYLPVLKEALENAKPRPVTPKYPAVSKAIQDNANAAIRGEKDVDTVLADMKAAIEAAN